MTAVCSTAVSAGLAGHVGCVQGMNAEIESMMAAAQASAEEGVEEADVSQEEMAGRSVGRRWVVEVNLASLSIFQAFPEYGQKVWL